MSTRAELRADPEARQFAQKMVAADETMYTVLRETVTPVKGGGIAESGRTACGSMSNVKGPLARFPRSVDLDECPWGLSGTWHSHVTRSQLLNPEHSLPDMANVAFGAIDVSVVTGAETSDVLVGSKNRGGMAEAYRNALGLDVDSTKDVVEALNDETITNPPALRRRVRSEFGDLFETHQTYYPEIQQEVDMLAQQNAVPAQSPAGGIEGLEPMYAAAYLPASMHEGQTHGDRLTAKSRRVNAGMPDLAEQTVRYVTGTAVGVVAKDAIRNALRNVGW